MKLRASDLWRLDGTLDRGPYVAFGLLLSALKYGIDFFLIRLLCGRTWTPLNYWMAGDRFGDLLYNPAFAAARWALLATTIPFVWTGIALTLRRLRSVGAPPILIILFFFPVFNFLLFVTLMFSSPQGTPTKRVSDKPSILGRIIPRSRFGSALLAAFMSLVPIVILILAGTHWLGSYGWGLFIGIPFLQGFLSTCIYEFHQPRNIKDSLGVTLASLGLLGIALLFIAGEGIICIFMASPLAAAIGWFGTVVAHAAKPASNHRGARTLLGLFLAVTLLMGMESEYEPEPPLQTIRTEVEIDAPPSAVWSHVVSFSEIPPPEEPIFKTGIAYPLRAEIKGTGVGAIRHCVFTTGPFVEPITTWDEPRLLAFGVTSQPAPMEEWTPYKGIHPPHLDGYFVSRRGQFLLTPLPGGKTLLEGTTWYTHRLWPTAYWGLWSDAVIHRIHGRVLQHVKRLAEEKGA